MRVINIEGIDAVGKETVSKALEKELIEKGYRVKRVSFPNYEGSIGKSIREVLMGACGSAPSLDPKLIGPFYTMDRLSYFKCNIDDLVDNYDYVIMDRSFYSNLMHQAAKYYISGKDVWSKPDYIDINCEIRRLGMSEKTLSKIFDWMLINYQWEIVETGLDRCDNMFTFVLTMSEEDSKRQLLNRTEVDTNETNRAYLNGCKEFISKLLNTEYWHNIKKYSIEKYISMYGASKAWARRNFYNAAYYYLDNVAKVSVIHVEDPEQIPYAAYMTVKDIIDIMTDNDMFDEEGDDTNGED